MVIRYDHGWYIIFYTSVPSMPSWNQTVTEKNSAQITGKFMTCGIHHYGQYTHFQIDDIRKLKDAKIRMVAITRDNFHYQKMSNYANVLIFKDFDPKA